MPNACPADDRRPRSAPGLGAEQLLHLFEQAPSFMAVVHGPTHVFEMANHAYLQLVGHRDVVGMPVREALPEVEGQGFFELLDNVYETGKPFVGRGLRIDLQREQAGPVEARFVNFVYQPILNRDGEVYGIFAEGSDVTELFVAQEALAEKISILEKLEKRQALHLELADALRPLSSEEDILAVAARLLSRELGAQRVAVVEVDDKRGAFEARLFGPGAAPTGTVRAGRLGELGGLGNWAPSPWRCSRAVGLSSPTAAWRKRPETRSGHSLARIRWRRPWPSPWRRMGGSRNSSRWLGLGWLLGRPTMCSLYRRWRSVCGARWRRAARGRR